MRKLTWDAIIARRLSRHHLVKPAARAKIADVVGDVCGIHAQVMTSAYHSLGLRIVGITRVDIDAGLWERRELVKTFGVRGTVHLLPARELGWWLAALRAGARADPRRLAYLGITAAQLVTMTDAVGEALVGRALTREELGAAVVRRVRRSVDRTMGAFGGQWPVWQAAIGEAALAGTICFGPSKGARATFVRVDEWIGKLATPDPEQAQREMLLRYLAAYGPATVREFAQWAALDRSAARELALRLGGAVEEVDVEGVTALQVAGDRSARALTATSTLLLPRFDAYVVGSHPRDVLIPPAVVDRAAATGLLHPRSGTGRAFLAGPMPVLVLDGRVVGLWDADRSARRLTVRVQPFVRLEPQRRDALEDAAQRLGEILGLEVALTMANVRTRPHL
ncbi:MAG: winged helix DNA-binding domain-containing protein [Chloroflexota bacterium]|nr:winged helix DNA-binding domain-containing protein [Chloroflexota bacterium]